MYGEISETSKKKSREEINLKFYTVMAVPVPLYGSETAILKERDWNGIQTAEIKYLRTLNECTRTDQ
jgi:hypothetical protein